MFADLLISIIGGLITAGMIAFLKFLTNKNDRQSK